MARFGRGFPIPRQRRTVLASTAQSASGNLTAAFSAAAASPTVIVPASGNLTAAFSAGEALGVVVPARGGLTVSFSAGASVALALPSASLRGSFTAALAAPTLVFPATAALVAAFTASLANPLVVTPATGGLSASFTASSGAHLVLAASADLRASFVAKALIGPYYAIGALLAKFTAAVLPSEFSVSVPTSQPGIQYPYTVLHMHYGIYVGVGPPAAKLGTNGDLYYRRDGTIGTNRVYTRASGSWSAVA